MSFRPAVILALGVLSCARLLAGPTPASAEPFPSPAIPKNALAYWSSAKTQLNGTELTVYDVVGGNNFTSPASVTALPAAGITFEGNQSAPVKITSKQIVSPEFCISLDMLPSGLGAEHQTPLYLYTFCELRYRLSRSELTLNVWRKDNAGDVKTAGSVKLPIVTGKWNRVQVVISGDIARLTINGVFAQTALDGTWDNLVPAKPLMIGFGGTDRAFSGKLDHILFTPTP
jgi:hypothetical protein